MWKSLKRRIPPGLNTFTGLVRHFLFTICLWVSPWVSSSFMKKVRTIKVGSIYKCAKSYRYQMVRYHGFQWYHWKTSIKRTKSSIGEKILNHKKVKEKANFNQDLLGEMAWHRMEIINLSWIRKKRKDSNNSSPRHIKRSN